MWVIMRDDGKYVRPSGSEHSYTGRLELAQVYRDRADAVRDCCALNEVVVSIYSLCPYVR